MLMLTQLRALYWNAVQSEQQAPPPPPTLISAAAADVLKPGALFADLTSAAPSIIRESSALFATDAYIDVASAVGLGLVAAPR